MPTTSTRRSRPSGRVARAPRPLRATTCAHVSMKPSLVSATALPAPDITVLPPRLRRCRRRLATLGDRRCATSTTTRE